MSTIVFLGGGRITSAIVKCFGTSNAGHRLIVHDHRNSKLRALKRNHGVSTEPDLQMAVAKADVLIIAVRPDSLQDLLAAIGKVNRPLLAVSVAAGVPLRVLKRALGAPVKWARAMPSPVCCNSRGLTALSYSSEISKLDKQCIRKFFAILGEVLELPEAKLDAFTVTYSSTHGYHALQTLAAAGRSIGLDTRTALLASTHALLDGVLAWRRGKRSLDSLLDEAATPDGIAASTISAMDAHGYRRAVYAGLAAGLRRAKANSE